MHIDAIQNNLQALNASAAKIVKVKAAAPAKAANGHTVLTQDEQLQVTVARIVAALNLESQGVTTEALVARVREYERPYAGVVQ